MQGVQDNSANASTQLRHTEPQLSILWPPQGVEKGQRSGWLVAGCLDARLIPEAEVGYLPGLCHHRTHGSYTLRPLEIHVLLRHKLFLGRWVSIKHAPTWELEDMLPPKEGRLEGLKSGDKGLLRGGGGQREKMGVFVDTSNRIVF